MKLFPKIQNPWPAGLVLFFIVFTAYIVGFVVFASRQKMDLVRQDYYDQEIRFQQQIDRVRRTTPVLADAGVSYDRAGESIIINLLSLNREDVSGAVSFYRPSDAGMDSNVSLGLDATGRQVISVRSLGTGFWKVRIQWKTAGQEYYFEKPIVIRRSQS